MILSYKNIIRKGIYFNGLVDFYRSLNLNSIFIRSMGLSYNYFKYFYIKFNYQLPKKINKLKYVNVYLFKKLNIEFLKIIPIYFSFTKMLEYTFMRFYSIRHFKGICFLLNKPANGQRTWSNSNTNKIIGRLKSLLDKKDFWVI